MEQRLQNLTFGKALLIGLAVTAAYFFMFYDDGSIIESSISNNQTQITAKEQELATIKKAIADAERYQAAKKTLGEELDVVLKAIPSQLTSTDLMKVLSTEAKTVGASILSINQQGGSSIPTPRGAPKPFFEPVTVTVSLEGTYNQLMLFLSNLTKTDRIITVSSLNLQLRDAAVSASGDLKGPTLLKMNGEFKAYRYSAEKGTTPGG